MQENEDNNLSMQACTFEAYFEKALINIRFPCDFFLEWKSVDGVDASSSDFNFRATEGTIEFNKHMTFSTNMLYDTQKQWYRNKQAEIILYLISKRHPNLVQTVGKFCIELSSITNLQSFSLTKGYKLACCSINAELFFRVRLCEVVPAQSNRKSRLKEMHSSILHISKTDEEAKKSIIFQEKSKKSIGFSRFLTIEPLPLTFRNNVSLDKKSQTERLMARDNDNSTIFRKLLHCDESHDGRPYSLKSKQIFGVNKVKEWENQESQMQKQERITQLETELTEILNQLDHYKAKLQVSEFRALNSEEELKRLGERQSDRSAMDENRHKRETVSFGVGSRLEEIRSGENIESQKELAEESYQEDSSFGSQAELEIATLKQAVSQIQKALAKENEKVQRTEANNQCLALRIDELEEEQAAYQEELKVTNTENQVKGQYNQELKLMIEKLEDDTLNLNLKHELSRECFDVLCLELEQLRQKGFVSGQVEFILTAARKLQSLMKNSEINSYQFSKERDHIIQHLQQEIRNLQQKKDEKKELEERMDQIKEEYQFLTQQNSQLYEVIGKSEQKIRQLEKKNVIKDQLSPEFLVTQLQIKSQHVNRLQNMLLENERVIYTYKEKESEIQSHMQNLKEVANELSQEKQINSCLQSSLERLESEKNEKESSILELKDRVLQLEKAMQQQSIARNASLKEEPVQQQQPKNETDSSPQKVSMGRTDSPIKNLILNMQKNFQNFQNQIDMSSNIEELMQLKDQEIEELSREKQELVVKYHQLKTQKARDLAELRKFNQNCNEQEDIIEQLKDEIRFLHEGKRNYELEGYTQEEPQSSLRNQEHQNYLKAFQNSKLPLTGSLHSPPSPSCMKTKGFENLSEHNSVSEADDQPPPKLQFYEGMFDAKSSELFVEYVNNHHEIEEEPAPKTVYDKLQSLLLARRKKQLVEKTLAKAVEKNTLLEESIEDVTIERRIIQEKALLVSKELQKLKCYLVKLPRKSSQQVTEYIDKLTPCEKAVKQLMQLSETLASSKLIQ